MKKFLLILMFLVILLVVPLTSAYYFNQHEYWILWTFENVNSPITNRCRPHLEVVLNGVEGADIPVIHYFDEKVTSYIGTHQRGSGYQKCLEEAGSDIESQCFCYGVGTHIVQDYYSHSEVGIVYDYLKSWAGSNSIHHLIVERQYEKKHLNWLEKNDDKIVTSGTLKYYDDRVLNLMFEEFGGDRKYIELMNEMTGLDVTQDAKVIRSGYQGESFYSAVYKNKVKLPFWVNAIGWLIMAFGLVISIVIFIFGKTKWKYLMILPWIIIFIFGIILTISFFTGTTWKITNFLIEIPPLVGYMNVDNDDIKYYDDTIKRETVEFFKSGTLKFDDASGLSYVDRYGNEVTGPLTKAERPFKYIVLPILTILFTLSQIWLFLKTFLNRGFFKKNRKK